MALIYRSILEIDDPHRGFVDRSRDHLQSWLRWKLAAEGLEVPSTGDLELPEHGIEIQVRFGENDECSVRRLAVFESAREDGVRVKTTLTAITDSSRSWAWIDLERWTHDHLAPPWVPAPPGIVGNVLREEDASRGALKLEPRAASATGAEGALVSDLVRDAERDCPLVVVSYSEREDNGPVLALERGRELSRRLAGIAPVYVLGEGAVTAFSKAITSSLGDGMDVHSGAVRAYLPGTGSPNDYPYRHRYVPFHKLRDRRPDLAALILGPFLLRRAVEVPPPAIWRTSARELVVGHAPDTEYEELLEMADAEISELRGVREQLDDERADNTDLQRRNDDLGRRLKFLRDRLREVQPAALGDEPQLESFDPVLCLEVVEEARRSLDLISIPESVDEGAAALDAHGDESWAKRAWSALLALQNYAELKRDGAFDGSFLTYCERSAGDFVVQASWVVPTETSQTLANRKFREQRILQVSTELDPTGTRLMPEHIRIEKGGTPSPRIHYYDDTRGPTGGIHIGWFGDHLDSWSKS